MMLIEVELAGEVLGSVMINLTAISEVEEQGENVKVVMTSGNTYVVTGVTFAAAINAVEDFKYLKINREPVEAGE